MEQSDMIFLARRMNELIELVQDPKKFIETHGDPYILPDSYDHQLSWIALYLIVGSYIRGKGLKDHPRSKSLDAYRNWLEHLNEQIDNEVFTRPHLYPCLHGVFGRQQAAVQIDWMMSMRENEGDQDD